MERLDSTCGFGGFEHKRLRHQRRLKRAALVVALGVAPGGLLAWSGCSDSTSGGGGGTYVDPGGTHGAELTVTVNGRGRVTANIPGVDCPSDCFAKYVFSSTTVDGAAGGVTLKAHPTPGASFKGWSFSTEPVGSRGRGPDNCNPVQRPGAQPPVNASDLEITLPYGEVTGTAPAGQEGACGAYTKVPTVYKVTANFDVTVDSGVDGGAGETLYAAAGTTAGREIGVSSGKLFWLTYAAGTGYYNVNYGTSPASTAPQTANTLASALSGVTLFEVDAAGVVYQATAGVSFIASDVVGSPVLMAPAAPSTCMALAVDSNKDVYCRTATTIVRWKAPAYSAIETLFSSVAAGSDLHIEGTSTAYFTTATGVYSFSLTGSPDGGVVTPTTVSNSVGSLSGLEGNTSYLWWVQSGYLYAASKGLGTAVNTGSSAFASGITAARMAADPSSSSYFWAASTSTIYRSYYLGGSVTTTFRSGLSSIYGIAADSSYVYWTQSDGSVRRVSTSGGGG